MPPSKFKAPLRSSSQSSGSSQESVREDESNSNRDDLSKISESQGKCSSQHPENSPERKQKIACNVENLEGKSQDKENYNPHNQNTEATQGASGSKTAKRSFHEPPEDNAGSRKRTKKADKPTKPAVSLTDEAYERIFRAVLSHTEDEPIKAEPDFNASSVDLFEFSQSDLEDLDEDIGKRSNSPHDTSIDQQSLNSLAPSSQPAKNGDGVNRRERSSSPMVAFFCHPSQPSVLAEGRCQQKTSAPLSQEQSADNRESHTVSAALVPGPVDRSPATKSLNEPDKNEASQCLKPPNTSSLQPETPSRSQDTPAQAQERQTPSQSQDTPAQVQERQTPSQSQDTPAQVQERQTPSQGQDTPAQVQERQTPSQSQDTPAQAQERQTPSQSQDTPAQAQERQTPSQSQDTPAQVQERQTPSQSQDTPAQVQERQTPSQGQVASNDSEQSSQKLQVSQGRISSESQQLSQEFFLSQPPSQLTAKQRLEWLMEKRVSDGLWVQCDNSSCGKWRYMPQCRDPCSLPDKWFCSLNPDQNCQSCDVPEKRLSLHAEEDMIFNKYSPGSVVWARVDGYPWWPAMVEDDPDLELFYWISELSDIPTWYHVVFFDDGHVSRAWVQTDKLKRFLPDSSLVEQGEAYSERLSIACRKANKALKMDVLERLRKYSFATTYTGPIGGRSSRKYRGSLGCRERV